MTLENSWSANGDNITEAIATFVHSSGLPFSIVERDAFKNMIEAARLQPKDYKIPTRKQIGNQHLDFIYNSVVETNEKKLTKHAEHFGLYFMVIQLQLPDVHCSISWLVVDIHLLLFLELLTQLINMQRAERKTANILLSSFFHSYENMIPTRFSQIVLSLMVLAMFRKLAKSSNKNIPM